MGVVVRSRARADEPLVARALGIGSDPAAVPSPDTAAAGRGKADAAERDTSAHAPAHVDGPNGTGAAAYAIHPGAAAHTARGAS